MIQSKDSDCVCGSCCTPLSRPRTQPVCFVVLIMESHNSHKHSQSPVTRQNHNFIQQQNLKLQLLVIKIHFRMHLLTQLLFSIQVYTVVLGGSNIVVLSGYETFCKFLVDQSYYTSTRSVRIFAETFTEHEAGQSAYSTRYRI